MATYGPVMVCNGYNPVTGSCASKSIPANVPPSKADAYLTGQYSPASTAQTSPQDDVTPEAGFTSGNFFGPITGVLNGISNAGASTVNKVTDTAKGVGSLLSIATDLPRLGTILVGGLLIAAGLFALAGGNRVIQITRG